MPATWLAVWGPYAVLTALAIPSSACTLELKLQDVSQYQPSLPGRGPYITTLRHGMTLILDDVTANGRQVTVEAVPSGTPTSDSCWTSINKVLFRGSKDSVPTIAEEEGIRGYYIKGNNDERAGVWNVETGKYEMTVTARTKDTSTVSDFSCELAFTVVRSSDDCTAMGSSCITMNTESFPSLPTCHQLTATTSSSSSTTTTANGPGTEAQAGQAFAPEVLAFVSEAETAALDLVSSLEDDGEVKSVVVDTPKGPIDIATQAFKSAESFVMQAGDVSVALPGSSGGLDVPGGGAVVVTRYPPSLIQSGETLVNPDLAEVIDVSIFARPTSPDGRRLAQQVPVLDLLEPIRIRMPAKADRSAPECSARRPNCQYFDPIQSAWIGIGLNALLDGAEELVCETRHLSLFAGAVDSVTGAFLCANLGIFTERSLDLFFGSSPDCGTSWLEHPVGWVFWSAIGLTFFGFVLAVVLELYTKRSAKPERWHDECFILPASGDQLASKSAEGEGGAASGNHSNGGKPDVNKTGAGSIAQTLSRVRARVHDHCRNHVVAGRLGLHPKDVQLLAAIHYAGKSQPSADAAGEGQQRQQTEHQLLKRALWQQLDQDPALVKKFTVGLHRADTLRFRKAVWSGFRALHKVRNIMVFSIASPYTLRYLIMCCGLWSSAFMTCLFFQSSGLATQLEGLGCKEPEIPFLRTLTCAVVSSLYASILFFALNWLANQRRFVPCSHKALQHDEQKVPEEERRAAAVRIVARWRLTDTTLEVIVFLYTIFCIAFCGLFHAQVRDKDRSAFLSSMMLSLVGDNIVLPFVLSVALVALCRFLASSPAPDAGTPKPSPVPHVIGQRLDGTTAYHETNGLLDPPGSEASSNDRPDLSEIVDEHQHGGKRDDVVQIDVLRQRFHKLQDSLVAVEACREMTRMGTGEVDPAMKSRGFSSDGINSVSTNDGGAEMNRRLVSFSSNSTSTTTDLGLPSQLLPPMVVQGPCQHVPMEKCLPQQQQQHHRHQHRKKHRARRHARELTSEAAVWSPSSSTCNKDDLELAEEEEDACEESARHRHNDEVTSGDGLQAHESHRRKRRRKRGISRSKEGRR